MPIRAVLLDVFDTLVANGPDIWLGSFESLCSEQRLPVDPQHLWDRWIVPERLFRKRRLDRGAMTPREPFETYEEAWTGCFREVFSSLGLRGDPVAATRLCIRDLGRRPIFPEVQDALERLGAAAPLAVLSNADRSFLHPLLEHHGLGRHFTAVLCSEDVRAYKPHPMLFQRLLERLGVEPRDAIHVGDALEEDVWGARLAGVRSAWVNRGGGAPPADCPPDFELRSLADLLGVLEEEGEGARAVGAETDLPARGSTRGDRRREEG